MNEQDLAALTAEAYSHSNERTRGQWLAIKCPYHHDKDKAGKHAYFNLEKGYVQCWGTHGYIPAKEVAQLWGVVISTYTPPHALYRA